jgi:ketosteroid isomerase-like protein
MQKNIAKVFKIADEMNATSFSNLLTDDVEFRFSNNDVWRGKEPVVTGLNYLFSKINGLRHDITGIYSNGKSYAVEATANYTMKDGKIIALPAVSVIRYRKDLIDVYRIYMDISPVLTYDSS